MASIVSIIPIVLLFILMLGFKMAGHKSALLTLVITVLLALFAASPLGMIAPELPWMASFPADAVFRWSAIY